MSTDSKTPNRGTLLIAEDETDFREILADLFRPLATEVLLASNGKEALQLVRSRQVDAVLTDVKMPEMTGLQFLANIRAEFFQTPVIVLTGQGDFATIQEALRLDATDFVEKPCENATLKESVKKALAYGCALRQMEDELDVMYAQSGLPPDEVVRMKRIRRVTLGMKIGFSSYTKKTA